MKRQPSITLRLTLLFALASAATIICVGGFVAWEMNNHFKDMDVDELSGKLELIAHAIDESRNPSVPAPLPSRLNDALVGHHALSARIFDHGTLLFESGDARFPKELLASAMEGEKITRASLHGWDDQGASYRGIAVKLPPVTPNAAPLTVALAINIAVHQRFAHSVQWTIWVAVGCAIFLTSVLAWFTARRGLAPLHDIAQVAKSMSAEHLNARLPIESVPLELNDLARSFNEMLSRLEDSFQRLSDFSSDIAHELRTPISNLMTQTQVALSKARDADEYREILYSNLEEYQRLATMIADMLFLAKADNGLIIPSREPVDLAAEVKDLFTFYEALAEDQGITLVSHGAESVLGDRLMLRRALSNLLSNAIRHTPRHGTVSVNIARAENDFVSVVVENPGEPIPAEHLPRVFDRFYRIDPSRQRTGEGAGLGLAITRSIILAHGGQVLATSGATTRFEVRLPTSATLALHLNKPSHATTI